MRARNFARPCLPQQKIPQVSLFQDDIFELTCERVLSQWRVLLNSSGLSRARMSFIGKPLHSLSLTIMRLWGFTVTIPWLTGQNFLLPTFHSQIPIYCLRRRREMDHFQIHEKCLWCSCINAPWNNTCSDRSATRSGNSLTSIQPRIWASTRSNRQSVGYCYFSRPCACVLEIWAISQGAKGETISNIIVRILWIIQRSYVTRHEGEELGFNSQWRYITSISASSVTLFLSASLQYIKYDSQVAVEVLAQKKVISWLCFVVQYTWVSLFTRPSAYCVYKCILPKIREKFRSFSQSLCFFYFFRK